MNATCVLENKDPHCCWSGPTVPPISEGQRPISGRGKKAILCNDCSPIYAIATLLYQMLQSTLGYIRYSNSARVNMVASKNIAFKIAAKPLQTETWLLLTAYS